VHTEHLNIAIAGATGFVGRALIDALLDDSSHHLIALSRRAFASNHPRLTVRTCDLLALDQSETALQGADLAVYLIHAMWPQEQLRQGSFADCDLLAADNFARAARQAGVKRIVFLSGLQPDLPKRSLHLRSRLEVEGALASHHVPLTVLRAGIILGAGGSSFQIFTRLVQRFPAIPRFPELESRTQPIALDDTIRLLRYVIDHPVTANRTYDIGGPDVMTYTEMLEACAQVMGLRRLKVPIPWAKAQHFGAAVSHFTHTPKELVEPLLESLAYPMVAKDHDLQDMAAFDAMPFTEALKRALDPANAAPRPHLLPPVAPHAPKRALFAVHRLQQSPRRTALAFAKLYMQWLPRYISPPLFAEHRPGTEVILRVRTLGMPLLRLELDDRHTEPSSASLQVTGGLLAPQQQGRLNFRIAGAAEHGQALLAVVDGYKPLLPWELYRFTQAPMHARTMEAFARFLREATAKDG